MKQKEDVKKEKREHIFNKLEERCAISLNGWWGDPGTKWYNVLEMF